MEEELRQVLMALIDWATRATMVTTKRCDNESWSES